MWRGHASRAVRKPITKLNKQIAKSAENQEFQVVRLGKGRSGRGARFSRESMFSMALRRNVSNISAGDFVLVVLEDVSGQPITRFESMCGSALIAAMQAFMVDLYDYCFSNLPAQVAQSHIPIMEAEWKLACVSFTSDATNSNIWQRRKLMVTEASAAYIADHDLWKCGDFYGAVYKKQCVSLECF